MPKLVILGLSITVPEPFPEGHVCTKGEAQVLSQALSRSLGRGLHRVIMEECAARGRHAPVGMSELDLRDIQARATSFVTSHSAGFSQGHERLRSIEVEARRIAQGMVEARLYARGETLTKPELEEAIARVASEASVLAEATRRVDAIQAIAQSAHADLLGAGWEDEE